MTHLEGDVRYGEDRVTNPGIDEYTDWEEKPSESEDDADSRGTGTDSTDSPLFAYPGTGYAGGETAKGQAVGQAKGTLGHPDQGEYARLHAVVRSAISEQLELERKAWQAINDSAVRVTSNLSGQVSFQRYTVSSTFPIQIVREKRLRGDLVIVNFTDAQTVYIGLHSGILVAGTDTVAIVGTTVGTSRRIRTKRALWAIASANVTIDVQEEFD